MHLTSIIRCEYKIKVSLKVVIVMGNILLKSYWLAMSYEDTPPKVIRKKLSLQIQLKDTRGTPNKVNPLESCSRTRVPK